MTIDTIEQRRVQIYRWQGHEDGKERIYFVDRALELIEQCGQEPNAVISLECDREGLSKNAEASTLEWRHITKADLKQPVIFITVWNEQNRREEHILIDGWHRFRKMVALGRTEPLQAYIFSLENSKLLELEMEAE